MNETDLSFENEVRKMRDQIYGKGSDKNWDACKSYWLQPEEVTWLKREVMKKTIPQKF